MATSTDKQTVKAVKAQQDLNGYREKIAEIDDEILELLIARFETTDKVGILKKQNNIPILNEEIEKSIFARLASKAHGKIESGVIARIYTEIFDASKARQRRL